MQYCTYLCLFCSYCSVLVFTQMIFTKDGSTTSATIVSVLPELLRIRSNGVQFSYIMTLQDRLFTFSRTVYNMTRCFGHDRNFGGTLTTEHNMYNEYSEMKFYANI